MIRQFPHCDARILHAPGECEYCDLHPEWQELRKVWGIAFTGHLPGPITAADVEGQGGSRSFGISWKVPAMRPQVWLPCPADFARPAGSRSAHQRWHGNVATTEQPDAATVWPAALYADFELEEVPVEPATAGPPPARRATWLRLRRR